MEKYSFTKLETFEQCPFKYKEVYINGNRSEESTLPLEIGGLSHIGKELWAEYLISNQKPNLNYIEYVVQNGIEIQEIIEINGIEAKNEIVENWLGINDLKNKYFESYMEPCNKSGMNYNEKVEIYLNSLRNEQLENGWKVIGTEENFQFIYEDRCILHGYIDRIDINQDRDLRVVDYKTSKEVYKSEKLATPLQMVIYSLACEAIYKKLPISHIYDFIFLGQQQNACTKGYLERGKKKLNSLLDKIEACEVSGKYVPKPSPLCYYCSLSNNTCAKDKELNGICQYYSLWTPNDRNFGVNKKWGEDNVVEVKREAKEAKKELVW